MKLAIIGRGRVAGALAQALSAHDIMFGVLSPAEPDEATPDRAAEMADAVILATPWPAESQVAETIKDHVVGKPVIDATNAVGMSDHGLDLVSAPGRAAAEVLQDRLPGAHVVKCFNQIGAEFMEDPGLLSARPVMFAAGNDAQARAVALALAAEAGFEAVDAGGLANARHLESLGMLWIWNSLKGDLGRRWRVHQH